MNRNNMIDMNEFSKRLLRGKVAEPARKTPSGRFRICILCSTLFALFLGCSGSSFSADFLLEDVQGKSYRLSDYRGKWVLVNFWATWCPPCLREIPELTRLHNAHQKKDLVVIGIAMDSGSSKTVIDFARAHGISYPVVMGNRKITAQIGAVDVLPVSYLYNPKGEQVSYQAGEVTRTSVEAYLENSK